MTIFKYKKGWKAEIYINGKRITSRSGFTGKRQAKEWHDRILNQAKSGSLEIAAPKVLFCDVLDFYIEHHLPTVRKGTSDRYLIDINYRLKPKFGHYLADEITEVDFARFRSELAKSVSIKSANNCLSLLKAILNKAKRWKMISSNVHSSIDLLKVPGSRFNWWDDKVDIARFVESIDGHRYCLAYRLALDLGLRLGEIIGLSKLDINLDRRQIHVHRQWLDKEHRYGPTKGNSDRCISYSEGGAIDSLISKAIYSSPHSEALFTTSTGKRLGARKLSGYYFPLAIEKAKVPKIRFHDLRHTFASWFMIKYDDIWSLKRILGHQDIQTTQKYAHLSKRHSKAMEIGW